MPRKVIQQHGDERLNRIYAKSPLDLLASRTAFQNRLESGDLVAMSFGWTQSTTLSAPSGPAP